MSKPLLIVTLFCALAGLMLFSASRPAPALAQQAASATPPPLRVEAYQDVTVRSGPAVEFDRVGVLIAGQTSAVLGRSPDSTWIQIEFVGGPGGTGWVLRDFVTLVGELPSIPTIVPPPTPTLPPTPTAELFSTPDGDATAAAEPNFAPTFTRPAPVLRPTLLPVQGTRQIVSFPPAVLIIVLLVLGVFAGMVSTMRTR